MIFHLQRFIKASRAALPLGQGVSMLSYTDTLSLDADFTWAAKR